MNRSKPSKADIASFFLGLSKGIQDKGDYIQMLTNRQIKCYQKGIDTGKGYVKDCLTGNAPGLTLSDYIEVALEDLAVFSREA